MSINWQDELQHSTGEIFEPEPENEQDIRNAPGPTYAASQDRLARAISDLTEYVFAANREKEKT